MGKRRESLGDLYELCDNWSYNRWSSSKQALSIKLGIRNLMILLLILYFITEYCVRDEFDCAGHDIRSTAASNMADCRAQCNADAHCRSIQILDNGNCWIKRHACTNEQLRRYVTGSDQVKVGKVSSFGPSTGLLLSRECLNDNILSNDRTNVRKYVVKDSKVPYVPDTYKCDV